MKLLLSKFGLFPKTIEFFCKCMRLWRSDARFRSLTSTLRVIAEFRRPRYPKQSTDWTTGHKLDVEYTRGWAGKIPHRVRCSSWRARSCLKLDFLLSIELMLNPPSPFQTRATKANQGWARVPLKIPSLNLREVELRCIEDSLHCSLCWLKIVVHGVLLRTKSRWRGF